MVSQRRACYRFSNSGAFTSRFDRRVAFGAAVVVGLAEFVTLLLRFPVTATSGSRFRFSAGEAGVMAMIRVHRRGLNSLDEARAVKYHVPLLAPCCAT